MTIIKINTGNGIVRPVHLKQIAWCNFFMSEFINSPKLGNGPLKSLIFFSLTSLTLVNTGESALPGENLYSSISREVNFSRKKFAKQKPYF